MRTALACLTRGENCFFPTLDPFDSARFTLAFLFVKSKFCICKTDVNSSLHSAPSDVSTYIYDPETGNYYDPIAGTYYDPRTQVSACEGSFTRDMFLQTAFP